MSEKFKDGKTYFDLSEAERKERAKLTAKESRSVSALIHAVRSLPTGLCIDVDDEGLTVSKRITEGAAMQVAEVKRRNLTF